MPASAEDLQAAARRQPCQLERLYGMITDLYIDKYRAQVLS
jgi:Bardet-Biedl syndrome 7 protein